MIVERVIALLVVLAVTAVVAALWRARDGRLRTAPVVRGDTTALAADIVAAIPTAARVVLVEFTAPACGPCARARAVLDQVAADRPAVAVAALDVTEWPDLVRAHRVMRAPTTVVVDRRGVVWGRVAGVPDADELASLVDRALADGPCTVTPAGRG